MIIEEKEKDPFSCYIYAMSVLAVIEFIAQIFIKYF